MKNSSNLTSTDVITFRLADPSDWPEIWPFWREIVSVGETHPYPLDATEVAARKIWLEPEGAAIYVAEMQLTKERKSIVAAMQTRPMRYGNGRHVANFDLMVAPWARGQGIGRQLASFVIEDCQRKGYQAMEAYSVVSVNPALKLWESLGFTKCGFSPAAFDHPVYGLVDTLYLHKWLIHPKSNNVCNENANINA